MKINWENTVITEIALAVYVAPNTGKSVHRDRPFHGLVLNDEGAEKEYIFTDGRILHAKGGELFYLPKGSSYTVRDIKIGGCYAINFAAEIKCEPFSLSLRGRERILHNFRAAAAAWRRGETAKNALAMRALYDAVYRIESELPHIYLPSELTSRITPALVRAERDFTDPTLTVSVLASLCGISEVYFRRLFLAQTGLSPKEYLIKKRMEYARTLLLSGDFSVSEVARLCGYAEPCHFSREFDRFFGVSPGRYRDGK